MKYNRVFEVAEVERAVCEGRRGTYIEGGNEENKKDRYLMLIVVDNILMNRLSFSSLRAAKKAIKTIRVKGEFAYVNIYDKKRGEVTIWGNLG
jgi:hypothetical protein